jgi:hypothetical protein
MRLTAPPCCFRKPFTQSGSLHPHARAGCPHGAAYDCVAHPTGCNYVRGAMVFVDHLCVRVTRVQYPYATDPQLHCPVAATLRPCPALEGTPQGPPGVRKSPCQSWAPCQSWDGCPGVPLRLHRAHGPLHPGPPRTIRADWRPVLFAHQWSSQATRQPRAVQVQVAGTLLASG